MKRLFAKRCVKNTLAVLLIAAMCGCAFFTMKYAQSHVGSGPDTIMSQSSGDSSQTADQQKDSSGDSQSAQSAQSGEEQGLCLTVSLPAVQIEPQEARSAAPAKPDGDSGGAPCRASISSAAETGQMGGPGGQSAGTASYSAVKEITSDETIKDETYSSENSD